MSRALPRTSRRYAWSTIDENGESARHIKTIDEHGATVGEHVEGYTRYGSRWFRVISGKPDVHNDPVEDVFGMLPLSIECQEGPERLRLKV